MKKPLQYLYLVVWTILVIFAAKHTLNAFETWLVELIPALSSCGLLLYVRNKPVVTAAKYFIGWSVTLLVACLVVWATYSWSLGWRSV